MSLLKRRAADRGVTLVELLVAVVLGSVLSAALVTAYLSAKREYSYSREMAQLQENARYAVQLLAREVAMAGFFGGLATVEAVPVGSVTGDCGPAPWALNAYAPLGLVDDHRGSGSPVGSDGNRYTCVDGGDVVAGSDLLAVKRTAAAATVLRGHTAPGLAGDDTRRWFLYLQAGGTPGWRRLAGGEFGALVTAIDSYWEARPRVFFVRRYSTSPDDGIPTLCMETLAGDRMVARCLVEGVETLQVEVGVDDDDDGVVNRYLSAPSATELRRARTVRIVLLLRAIAPVPGYRGRTGYVLPGGALVGGEDAYPRLLVSTTARLRNHRSVHATADRS